MNPPSAGGDGEPAIRAQELSKRYGDAVALSGLTMTVPRGEIFGFLGPNGSGKTTAVKLFLGLVSASGGDAWLLGRHSTSRSARERVGYLPELFRYQGWLSADEVLLLHCNLARLPRSQWGREVDAALATVGLTDHRSSRVGTFSKGMQQRLGIGVALLGRPELVILDEPTSALDPVGRHDVRAIIRGLRDRGCAVFLNSHLLSEVEQVCDRVAVVSRGGVLATGTIAELLRGDIVRLRLGGLDDAARAALAQRAAISERDGWIEMRGLRDDDIPPLVADLVSHGVRVYAVEHARQSLEDRFLALLQGGEP